MSKAKRIKKNREPQATARIIITAFNNGQIKVDGFPTNLPMALRMMHEAEMAIVGFFLRGEESRIIKLN